VVSVMAMAAAAAATWSAVGGAATLLPPLHPEEVAVAQSRPVVAQMLRVVAEVWATAGEAAWTSRTRVAVVAEEGTQLTAVARGRLPFLVLGPLPLLQEVGTVVAVVLHHPLLQVGKEEEAAGERWRVAQRNLSRPSAACGSSSRPGVLGVVEEGPLHPGPAATRCRVSEVVQSSTPCRETG